MLADVLAQLVPGITEGIREDWRERCVNAYLSYLGATGFLQRLAGAAGEESFRREALLAQQKERDEAIRRVPPELRAIMLPYLAAGALSRPVEELLPLALAQASRDMEVSKAKKELLDRFSEGVQAALRRLEKRPGAHSWEFRHPLAGFLAELERDSRPWLILNIRMANPGDGAVSARELVECAAAVIGRGPDLVYLRRAGEDENGDAMPQYTACWLHHICHGTMLQLLAGVARLSPVQVVFMGEELRRISADMPGGMQGSEGPAPWQRDDDF